MQKVSFEELEDFIVKLAEKFESLHIHTNWIENDYNEEIISFINKMITEELVDKAFDARRVVYR